MKTQFAAICALVQGVTVTQAQLGNRFEVEGKGETFKIDYSASRSLYSVVFFQDGVRSKYRFRAADGFVRKIMVDDLRYSAVYRTNGNLKRVDDLNDRRLLLEEQADEMEDEEDIIPAARRLDLLTCDDCATVWSLICTGGMDTLCDEITNGEAPLDEEVVMDSIETMCYAFRPLCDGYDGADVCDGQCDECDRALAFTLEWNNGDTDMDLRVDEPDGTQIRWFDREGSVGYLDQDSLEGGQETYRVWNGLSTTNDPVLGVYTAAARLVYKGDGVDSVTWKLTAEMNGVTVWTETGMFDTNGDQSADFTYDLQTYIDNGCDNEVLASIIAVEGDEGVGKPGSP